MKLKEFMKDSLQVSKGAMKIETKGVIEGYRERYDALRSDASKPFKYDIYTMTPGNRIVVHIKEPSETVNNFYYDVLFEISADKSAANFGDCDIKIFSNCPSFVYTVAYVFAHWNPDTGKVERGNKGLLIDSLKGKLPKERMLIPGIERKLGTEPIRKAPVVRNPMGIPMFDKSVYFAAFYLTEEIPFKSVINNHNFKAARQVFDNVSDFEHLMNERKRLEQKQKRAKQRAARKTEQEFKKKERSVDRRNQRGVLKPKSAIRVQGLTQVKKPKAVSSVKSTRRTTAQSTADREKQS